VILILLLLVTPWSVESDQTKDEVIRVVRRWVQAARQHQPGAIDQPLLDISQESPKNLEFVRRHLRYTSFDGSVRHLVVPSCRGELRGLVSFRQRQVPSGERARGAPTRPGAAVLRGGDARGLRVGHDSEHPALACGEGQGDPDALVARGVARRRATAARECRAKRSHRSARASRSGPWSARTPRRSRPALRVVLPQLGDRRLQTPPNRATSSEPRGPIGSLARLPAILCLRRRPADRGDARGGRRQELR